MSRLLFAALSLLALNTISAQVVPPAPRQDGAAQTARPVRTMRASRLHSVVRIDGKLDDDAWKNAEVSGDFTQSYPNAGQPATDRSEVRIVYDDAALYVGVRMFDSRPDSIAAQLARRDASGIYSDWLHLVIDSYHDRATAFRFSVNPLGVKKDVYHSNDRNEDVNWDAVWEVATTIDDKGWAAEYRIPFSQLRFGGADKGAERLWGLQVQRDIARRNQRDTWSPWVQTDPGYVSRLGDLAGIVDIPVPRRLEVMPYASSRLTRAPGDAANPFYRPNNTAISVGGDLKYGLPGGLTLNATVNPDFGQVEADPAVVNLSAFETSFPERRPFFVEGASTFALGSIRGAPSYGSDQLFYSRRIGRPPQRSAGGAFVDSPRETTILGAAKVSGRSRGWTLGLLDAVTDEERANVISSAGGRSTTAVEPRTNYFVGRVRRDMRQGNTILSIGTTAVNRDQSDSIFAGILRSRANVGEVDFDHAWHNRLYAISGVYTRSRIQGTSTVIRNAQTSSARYFQRPDADYVEVDPLRTSLAGYKTALSFQKGGNITLNAQAKMVSPDYEVNDLGFMGRADIRNVGANSYYNNFTPGKLFRNFYYGVGNNHAWNYGGNKIWESYFFESGVGLHNLWTGGFGGEYDPGQLDDRLTRGGPLARQPTQYGLYAYGSTDARRNPSFNVNASFYGDSEDGYQMNLSGGTVIRPSASIRVAVTPNITWYRNTIQYAQRVVDPAAVATFGTRYVLSDIRQTTLSATTRVEWTLTPDLSFQLYAQPFVSAGRYVSFKELRTPGTLEFVRYGTDNGSTQVPQKDAQGKTTGYTIDPDGAGLAKAFTLSNPDFRTASLNGNAVVRWEFRPGSALFFVWQQSRSEYVPYDGDFRIGRGTRDIFTRPTNVFLVKASYWFAK